MLTDVNVNNLVGQPVLTVVVCPCCATHMDVVAKGAMKKYLLECKNVECALHARNRLVVRKGKIIQVTKHV